MDRFLGMVVLHIGIRESKNVGKISVKVRKMEALKVCDYAMSFEDDLSQDTCSFQPVPLPNVQAFARSSYTLLSA